MSHQIKIKSFGPPHYDTIKIFLNLRNGIFPLKLIYVALIVPKCLSLCSFTSCFSNAKFFDGKEEIRILLYFLLDNYVTYLLILVCSCKHTFLVSKYALF